MTCAGKRARCICSLPAGHEGPHVCACEGSWDDDGWVYSWPAVVQAGPRVGERVEAPKDYPPLPYLEGVGSRVLLDRADLAALIAGWSFL